MIRPKRDRQTPAAKAAQYDMATRRDDDACQMVATATNPHGGSIQRDHRQNRDAFNTVLENLQCLCVLHHKWKTEHPEEADREGWGVPRRADPAKYPARRVIYDNGEPRLAWVLLVPDIDLFSHPKGYREIGESAARDLIENWEGVAA